MLKSFRFPTYTSVCGPPTTYCEDLSPDVFNYPFFNQGVDALRKQYAERKTFSLEDNLEPPESQLLPIKGFIFHTSHCGSTLLGRMLGSSFQVRMISEPESINGLLLSYLLNQLPEAQVLTQLKQIIEAYRISGDEKESIIFKLTSWNVFLIHFFHKLYPNTPWIYIDRESEKLVQTLKNKDGGFIDWWYHPVDILRKHFVENTSSVDFESYLRSIIEGHRKHAIAAQNGHELFVHYPDFLNALSQILAHFQLTFSTEELEKSLAYLRYDSKQFEPVLFEYSV